MTKSKIFKGLAVVNFMALLILFLLYRNGKFDKEQHVKGNGNISKQVEKQKVEDHQTIKENNEIKNSKSNMDLQRLSSSKSIVIIDDLGKKPKAITPTTGPTFMNVTNEAPQMMPSSKSAIIFDPYKKIADSSRNVKKD